MKTLWDSSSCLKTTIFLTLMFKSMTKYGPPRSLETGDTACHPVSRPHGNPQVFHETDRVRGKQGQDLDGHFSGKGRRGRESSLWTASMNSVRGLWRGRGFLSHLVPGPSMSGAGWVVAQTGSESGQWSREEMLDRFAWERPTVSCWLCLGNSQPREGSLSRISRAQMSKPLRTQI